MTVKGLIILVTLTISVVHASIAFNPFCYSDPCERASCPALSGAICKANIYCIPRFYDKYQNDVTENCQCQPGTKVFLCKPDPCKTARCDVDGQCFTDRCGGCDTIFWDRKKRLITQCPISVSEKEKMTCPPIKPGTSGICIQECNNDSDCPRTKLCCSNGCGRVCTDAYYPNCPRGLPLACKPPACDITTCPRQLQAKCDATCFGCIPRFFDKFGNEVTKQCECPRGSSPVVCKNDPCRIATCRNRRDVVCRTDTCGGCRARFYNRKGREVKCLRDPKPTCPPLRPGFVGTCVNRCRRDTDCQRNLKCCFNGCGKVCKVPLPADCKNLNCFAPACDTQTCAIHTQAKCRGECNSCFPLFFDKFGNDITSSCNCPGRIFEAVCKDDLCERQSCPAYPDAECRINRCGGCNTAFFDKNGKEVNCRRQMFDKRCPKVRPGDLGICGFTCVSNNDCSNNRICCPTACGGSSCSAIPRVYDERCPEIRPGDAGICGFTCVSNNDCSNDRICCPSACGGSSCSAIPQDDRCPPPDSALINDPRQFCESSCASNKDCSRGDICCNTGCRKECISYPFTDPTCPPSRGIGPCINRCGSNKDCNGGRICCTVGCGTQCIRPFVQDKACPAIDPTIKDRLASISCLTSSCDGNEDCRRGKICCDDGCSRQCVDRPVFDERCPLSIAPVSDIDCVTQCSSNSDCRSDFMCCGLFCGSKCVRKPRPCDEGQALAKCADICAYAYCPPKLNVKCRVHGCDGCKAEFYNTETNLLVGCGPRPIG